VPPTQFVLSVRLEDSVLDGATGSVLPRAGDDAVQPATGVRGDGFVCCGVFKYYLVPYVPAHLSLRAQLSVTRGMARAVFLRARDCPRFPEHVASDSSCTGECTLSWLTTFDEYDGSPHSVSTTAATVPNGLGDGCPAACPADRRYEGAWYVGVLALPGTDAEFSLETSLIEPPHIDPGHQCDPSAPECRAPLDQNTLGSAAPVRAVRAASVPTALACAAGALVLVRARRGRSAGSSSTWV
jgi:hypothetical protein